MKDSDYYSNEKLNNFIDFTLDIIKSDKECSESKHIGYLYLIDFGDNKTKIGITKNDPRIRLATLNRTGTIMPFNLSFIAIGICQEIESVEKILHTRWEELRCAGEWFDFSGEGMDGFKMKLIEDLYEFSFQMCFCPGWKKWKPSDDEIEEFAKDTMYCHTNGSIKNIVDFHKNQSKFVFYIHL